jgi:hypothetical protein
MKRIAILAGLGDYYGTAQTEFKALPFVYKNITDFMTWLDASQWLVPPPLLNEHATRDNILQKLTDASSEAVAGDTVLFYFTGHGHRHFNQATNSIEHYLVTATENAAPTPFDIAAFLNEINYASFIDGFRDGKRHLITIIDCCYAFGLIEGYVFQQKYHTVIAASSENALSFYDSNSLFFRAFSKNWDAANLPNLKRGIESEMIRLRAPNRCKIYLSSTFATESLK